MKKQFILGIVFGAVVLSFGLSFLNSVRAGEPIDGVDTKLGKNLGGLMVSSDLGINNVGTLPTSNFYFFKEWSRGIQRFFTIDSVAKAQLELNITNQTAAELLVVDENNPNNAGVLEKAYQNYTKAQERLIARLTALQETSTNPKVADLLKKVDEETAKHAVLLDQINQEHASQPEYKDLSMVQDADHHYIIAVFTAAGEKDADVKQKAEEQIKSAEVAISEANSAMQDVSTTRGINVNPAGSDARGSSIFDRWGNFITKAKGNLDNAKKAFAEGKYGEAYGQARSAEAMLPVLASGQNFPDKRIETTAPTPSPTGSPKINENQSPKPSIKASVSPTARPTPEKTETPASAGSPVR